MCPLRIVTPPFPACGPHHALPFASLTSRLLLLVLVGASAHGGRGFDQPQAVQEAYCGDAWTSRRGRRRANGHTQFAVLAHGSEPERGRYELCVYGDEHERRATGNAAEGRNGGSAW